MAQTAYDFSSPFFGAALITRNKERYPLWTDKRQLRSTVDRKPVAEIALSFLSELTVELNLGFIPSIKARLTPPYRDGMAFLESELAEWGINVLEVQLGYAGGTGSGPFLSPVFTGSVFTTEISMGENIEITLNAQGMSALDATVKKGGITGKDTRFNLLNQLLLGDPTEKTAKRGIWIDFDGVPIGTDARKLLLHDQIDFNQGMWTDWFAAWNLITQAKCWAIFTGEVKEGRDVLKIVSREDELKKKPEKHFVFYDFEKGQLARLGDKYVHPILSASSPTTAVFLPGASAGWIVARIDEKTRKAETGKDKKITAKEMRPAWVAGQERAMRHAENSGNIGDPDAGTKLPVAVTDSTAEQLQKAVEAEFLRDQTLMGVQLEIETLGCPDLMPGMVINIDGLSARYKGNYVVQNLTHTWGGSGASTKFTCISNTQRIFQQVVQMQGAVNAQPAKTATEASSLTATPKVQ